MRRRSTRRRRLKRALRPRPRPSATRRNGFGASDGRFRAASPKGTCARRAVTAACIQPTLGFLPARGDHPPALIAAFGIATEPEPGVLAIADDAVTAVQLVKLKLDGSGKADIEPNKIIIGKGSPWFANRGRAAQ